MSNVELLLAFVALLLLVILMYVRWIYLRLEYGDEDSFAPPPPEKFGGIDRKIVPLWTARGRHHGSTQDTF